MISEIKVTINNDEQNVSVPSTHAEEFSLRLNVFAADDLSRKTTLCHYQ